MLRTSTTFVWSLTMVCFILSSQTTAYWETKIGKPCTNLQDQPNAVTCRADFTGMLECKGTDVTSGTWQPITIGEREILCPPDRARCSEVDGKHICIAERPPNRKDWADWRCDEVPDGGTDCDENLKDVWACVGDTWVYSHTCHGTAGCVDTDNRENREVYYAFCPV